MTESDMVVLSAKIAALHDDVREVKELAKATNGRVRALEIWKASVEVVLRMRAATRDGRWTLLLAVSTAILGALIGHILAGG